MKSDSATGSSASPARRRGTLPGPASAAARGHGFARKPPLALAALLAVLLAGAALTGWGLASCSSSGSKKPEGGKSILNIKQGDTTIQVTESEEDGNPVVRVNTRYKGEDHSIVLSIDQPNYDVEIPLTVEQIAPQTAAAAKATPGGNFEDLLIAQYLEKAQESVLGGDYQAALRQVNLVLLTRPEHVQAHTMKGSIYYAMGNYQLANEEWQRVLTLDPSNQEVKSFMEFMKNRQGAPQPPLPGAAGAAPPAPGGRPAAAPAQPSRAGGPPSPAAGSAPAAPAGNPPGGGAR